MNGKITSYKLNKAVDASTIFGLFLVLVYSSMTCLSKTVETTEQDLIK